MTDSNISDLAPELQILCREWLAQCVNAGLKVKVTVTWRSATAQNAAKAAGLSKAAAGESPHNCCDAQGRPASRAFDFACFDADGNYITDGTNDAYRRAGEIGEALEMAWGGDFLNFRDPDHLQMVNWKNA